MFELTDLYHINLIWIILPSRCFLFKIFLRSSKRVFVFPGPLSSAWPPALAPNLYLPALAPNLYLTALAPNLYLPTLVLNFYLSPLVSQEPGLAYTNLVPQFVFTGSGLRFLLLCSDFAFTFLSIVVAVAVVILAIVVTS